MFFIGYGSFICMLIVQYVYCSILVRFCEKFRINNLFKLLYISIISESQNQWCFSIFQLVMGMLLVLGRERLNFLQWDCGQKYFMRIWSGGEQNLAGAGNILLKLSMITSKQ